MFPATPPRFATARVVTSTLLAALILAGCGGGGDSAVTAPPPANPNPAPGPTPAFAVSVNAIPAPVQQGDSTTVTVTVARSGGFAGPVELALDGVPAGVTSRLAAPTLAAGSTSTTVTFVVAYTAPPDTIPITLRATATGLAPQTAALSLVVTQRVAQLALRRKSPNDRLSTNRAGLPIVFDVILTGTDGVTETALGVASALPTGVTTSFSPSTLLGGTSSVTLAVDSTATPGDYTIDLSATAENATSATLAVPFTILDRARLETTLAPPFLTVARNSTGDASLTVQLINLNQFLTLEATGLPDDVTVTFVRGNIPVTEAFYTVRFTVGPNAPLGVFPIAVTVSAPGATSGTDSLMLTVAPAPVGGSTVFRFCGPNDARPIWFGIGRFGLRWSRVDPDAQGNYAFDLLNKNDAAWVTQNGPDDFTVTVFSGTEAELAQFGERPCAETALAAVSGQVVNLGATDSVQVAIGPRSTASPITAMVPGFSLMGRADQPQDLLAVRRRPATGSTAGAIDRILVRRGITLSDGGTVGDIDFASAEAFQPTPFTLALNGVAAAEQPTTWAEFETVGGARIVVSDPAVSGTAAAALAVPLSAQRPGDFHLLTGSARSTIGGDTVTRHVVQRTRTLGNSSVTLGPTPGTPTVQLSASNALRARYQTSVLEQPEYERLFSTTWVQEVGGMRRTMRMTATEEVTLTLGSPSERRLRAPEFTGAPGWDPSWEPRPRTDMRWSVTVLGWDAVGGIEAPRGDGVVTRGYTWTGVVLVP